MTRSPREILATSADPQQRRDARRAALNRIRICGWDAERAWTTPVGPRGRPRVRPIGPMRGIGRPSRPEPTWEEVSAMIDEHPDGMTLEEITEAFGVCRERIRQIEASALRKIAAALGAHEREIVAHLTERGSSPEAM